MTFTELVSLNSTFKKLAVQCSADTFTVNQSLVLRMSLCGKNHHLLVAENVASIFTQFMMSNFAINFIILLIPAT
jgi:hypothetical protein